MVKKINTSVSKKITIFLIVIFLETLTPLPASASSITETNIFNLTNSERAKYGLSGFSWNYKLAQAARAKAQDMLDKDYFSHTSPDGRSPWSFITAAGYNYIYAGENLAMNFSQAEDVVSSWMGSGGHRANMLSVNYRELGVGVITGEYQGYTTTVVVQMFGSQATQVYKDKKSPGSMRGSSLSGSTQTFNIVSLTQPSSEIIKKRIEDFKKACECLLKLVTEKV